jgi:hypothetical protein
MRRGKLVIALSTPHGGVTLSEARAGRLLPPQMAAPAASSKSMQRTFQASLFEGGGAQRRREDSGFVEDRAFIQSNELYSPE